MGDLVRDRSTVYYADEVPELTPEALAEMAEALYLAARSDSLCLLDGRAGIALIREVARLRRALDAAEKRAEEAERHLHAQDWRDD